MRKLLIPLFLVGLSFVSAVFSLHRASAKPPASAESSITIVQDQPGTRCTRLLYKDMEKRLKAGGSRCNRSRPHDGKFLANSAPSVAIEASPKSVMFGCPGGTVSSTCNGEMNVKLSTNGTDTDGDTLLYTYSTTGGRITGDGPNAVWDLSSVMPGDYTVTVEVDDGCGCIAFASTTATAAECSSCK